MLKEVISVLIERQIKADLYRKLKSAIVRNFETGKFSREMERVLLRLPFLGEGSSRTAYELNVEGFEPVVFKVANEGTTGIEQNKNEILCYESGGSSLLPEIYDWHNEYIWIEEELLEPIEANELEEKAGISRLILVSILEAKFEDRTQESAQSLYQFALTGERKQREQKRDFSFPGMNTKKIYDKRKARSFLLKLEKMIVDCGLEGGYGDLARLDHWGKDKKGQLKIIDFGFKGW